MQLKALCLSSLLLLAACASEPPREDPAPREAAPEQAAPPGVSDVPHADAAQVTACFPPALQRDLFHAESLQLLGLICEREPDEGEPAIQDEYPIRSAVALETPQLRARVLGALYEGLTHGGLRAMCFEPHHAIVARHGKRRWEILICYACSQVVVHEGGKRVASASIGDPGSAVLNEVLGQDGNIPSGEIEGRPFSHWLGRLKQIEAGEAEDERSVLGTLRAVLSRDPLSEARVAQLLAEQERRFALAPLDVIEFLRRVIREGRQAPARLAALRLFAKLAREEPDERQVAQAFLHCGDALLRVIREKLPGEVGYDQAPASATSPEIRAAAEAALRGLTWAEPAWIEGWIADTANDGPLTEERLLGLLKPLLERAQER